MNRRDAKRIVCQIAASKVEQLDAEAFEEYNSSELILLEFAREELASELHRRGKNAPEPKVIEAVRELFK